jgi:hypothetical protein
MKATLRQPFFSLSLSLPALLTLGALGGLSLATLTPAWAYSERMEHPWAMSEHESRSQARELALEAMRLKAAQAAGKIVEATSTLKDGKLREEVRTVGVSMVRISQVSDKLNVGTDGRSTLTVSALVEVDESELQRRAEQMRQDRDTARQVGELQRENERLRRSLGELSASIKAPPKSASVPALLQQQQDVMAALRRNETHIGNTFGPGALLAMAEQDGESWARAEAELQSQVFQGLLRMPVQAKVMSVEKLASGNYQARLQVGWKVPVATMKPVLAKHLKFYGDGDDITISGHADKLSLHADRIRGQLQAHSVEVLLSLGGANLRLPLMYANTEFFGTSCGSGLHGPNAQSKVVICSQKADVGANVNVAGNREDNPIRLTLSPEQAAQARSLRAFVVLKRNGSEVARQEVDLAGTKGAGGGAGS